MSPARVPHARWRTNVGLCLPGLASALVAIGIGLLVHSMVGAISPLVLALLLGMLVANVPSLRALHPGARFVAKRLLKMGVVPLGLQLSLDQLRSVGATGLITVLVTAIGTFTGTRWIGRRMGFTPGPTLLIATGFSICAASAVAAAEGLAGSIEGDVMVAVALVTICGTISIFLFPVVGPIFGLKGVAYGKWLGASVQDIGQVVAAASAGRHQPLDAAVVLKLSR